MADLAHRKASKKIQFVGKDGKIVVRAMNGATPTLNCGDSIPTTNELESSENTKTIEQIFKTLFTILIVEQIGEMFYNNTKLMAAIANVATTLATLCSMIYILNEYKNLLIYNDNYKLLQ